VLRLSEALSQCREPEDLTKILSEEPREFLEFLQFYIIVYRQNSSEVERGLNLERESQIALIQSRIKHQGVQFCLPSERCGGDRNTD